MKRTNETTRRVAMIVIIIVIACFAFGCLGGDNKSPEQKPETPSAPWTPPQHPYIKSIDTSKLKLGEPSDATITIFNNGNETVMKERIVMTATAVKLDNFAANLALKTKSDEEKTETYSLEFTEQINSGESCALSAEFDLPAKVSGVSIAGLYHVTIKVYTDDTLIGTKNLDLHLKA